MLHAVLPLEGYERLRLAQRHPAEQMAFKQIAEVLSELGTYTRFIAIDLALVQVAPSVVKSDRGLKKSEVHKVVHKYIGVSGGYLGDFSYRSHHDFYIELDLDIDPYKYVGTTRERFIQILSEATPDVQSRVLEGILERFPVGGSELRTADRADEVRTWIARLRSGAELEPRSLPALAAPPSATLGHHDLDALNKEASMPAPINLFFSYSHKDEALRDELATHLKLLERTGVIRSWHDRRIGAGDDWKAAIDTNLEGAHAILLAYVRRAGARRSRRGCGFGHRLAHPAA